ncbi:MAG: response regulator [Acidimicrobiales bacterium]
MTDARNDAQSGTVLVVEDSTTQQLLLLRQLEGAGVSADAVASVGEAIDAVEHESYQLILTDVHLPDGTAFDMIPQLKQRFRGPIVCLTASDRVDTEAALREAGADEVVAKPIDLAELWWMLDRWMAPAFDEEKFGQLAVDVGGGEVLNSIVSTFAGELPERVAALVSADRVDDDAAVRHEAHTLKSGAALVGAAGLAGWCAYLDDGAWTRNERRRAVRRVRSLAAATEAELVQRLAIGT